jgi:chromosome segregation ATPase
MKIKSRYSGEIGDLLESFLDNNVDDISPNMIQELESLGDEIETAEENYNAKISELESELSEAKQKIEELESELEDK